MDTAILTNWPKEYRLNPRCFRNRICVPLLLRAQVMNDHRHNHQQNHCHNDCWRSFLTFFGDIEKYIVLGAARKTPTTATTTVCGKFHEKIFFGPLSLFFLFDSVLWLSISILDCVWWRRHNSLHFHQTFRFCWKVWVYSLGNPLSN